MAVEYADPSLVTEVRETDVPMSGQTTSGYGGQIPTRHMIKYAGVWRRVYAMSYGNGGIAYVKVGGRNVTLDADTEHRLTTGEREKEA
jgi:hypothetical protein